METLIGLIMMAWIAGLVVAFFYFIPTGLALFLLFFCGVPLLLLGLTSYYDNRPIK